MRPHDAVVLLKVASKGDKNWLMKDLANELEISAIEISKSINRSVLAGLVSGDKKSINKLALLNFSSDEIYVWPFAKGIIRGQAIEPLHPNLQEACLRNSNLYELVALTDSISVGKVREKQLALAMIQKGLKNA
jgi:hypothetical protein